MAAADAKPGTSTSRQLVLVLFQRDAGIFLGDDDGDEDGEK